MIYGESFVRIDTLVRDRLKKHCQQSGLVMSALVSQLCEAYLNRRGALGRTRNHQPKPAKK